MEPDGEEVAHKAEIDIGDNARHNAAHKTGEQKGLHLVEILF